jgi:hypothetical protein
VLFRPAPRIAVRAPRVLTAGASADIVVELVADRPTRIRHVDVELIGRQGWRSSASGDLANEMIGPRASWRVRGEGELPAGATRFTMRCALPELPPSHDIGPGHASLVLSVHVAMPWWEERPWWPSTRRSFALVVRGKPPASVVRTPLACRTATTTETAPRLELALASTRLVIGERVPGSCALFHVDDRKPYVVTLQFVPVLQLHGARGHRSQPGVAFRATVELPAGSTGKTVPFSLQLPGQLTPSFRGATHDLAWRLVVGVELSLLGGKLELTVPIEVIDAAAAAGAPRLDRAPRLTDQRAAQLFDRYAATNPAWRVVEPDDDDDAHVLARSIDDSALRLAYRYRGRGGTFLRATIATPSLGLGLRVTPRRAPGGGPVGAQRPWQRAHDVAARFDSQAAPVVRVVSAAMTGARALGTLVEWRDDAVVYERPIKALDAGAITAAAAALVRVDAAIRAARAAVEPPPDVELDVPAWRALASRWHGRFNPGDVSLTGTLHGRTVEIAVDRGDDHVLRAIVARVGHAADAAGRIDRDGLDATIAQVVAGWPASVTDLAVSDDGARAQIALDAARLPALVDAAEARALAERLAALLAALVPTSGPYR